MAFCSQALPTQQMLSNLEEPCVINAHILLSNTGIEALKSDRDRALLSSEKRLLCPTVPQVWSVWDQIASAFALIFRLWVVRTENDCSEVLQESSLPSSGVSSAEEGQEGLPAAWLCCGVTVAPSQRSGGWRACL